ncbi:folate-binding protein YgfZ [Martelella lutilitoris]|uniref:Folate-binding protein YgfZ n=1 Tax=Martelella lutilitoris TaxID=2583532 RepID=A0A7T7KKH7_9HYPH|nr:folate-binding protein YgfZ [Martelella lutilitoris]QQM28834.1 folate-binding protein YgfZ [Martelella lutilitoris]
MALIHLPDRAFITLEGEDAEAFLQNLITTNIDGLAPGEAWPGALLTPQGKIMFDFLISRGPAGFLIETHAGDQAALAKRLMLYKLRAKVTIGTPAHDGVTAIVGEDTIPDSAVADRRFSLSDVALFRLPDRLDGAADDPETYTALRIEAGAAEMHADFAAEDAFPHDVLFDRNGGLNFRKGCYVGQEVVSRMQHRGTARRRLVRLEASEPFNTDQGTVEAGGKYAGSLGSVSGHAAMAIVRIDRIAAAAGDVSVGGLPVSVTPYAWSGVSLEPTGAEPE